MTAQGTDGIEARRGAMRICAAATREDLDAIVANVQGSDAASDLRPAESGLVMLRGRIGGEGAAFNVGEATVVRAAVRLADGTQGFAYHLGRDQDKARQAAIVDALFQQAAWRSAVIDQLAAIAERLATRARDEAKRTAATRVNFFTMTRGED